MNQPTKNVLITGVSSGIGNALTHHYINTGASVYGVSRRNPEKLLNESQFQFRKIDLEDTNSIEPAVHELLEGVEKLDLVILNAGMLGEMEDISNVGVSHLQRIMDVNVWANKAVLDSISKLPILVKQVTAISSGASINAHRGLAGYSISKAALNMMIKHYAIEWPEVHFTALSPGLVDTAMQDYLCNDVEDERFKSVTNWQSKRGTDVMPTASVVAPKLAQALTDCRSYPNGVYLDMRDMKVKV